MLLTPRDGPWSLDPKVQGVPVYSLAFLHSYLPLSRRTKEGLQQGGPVTLRRFGTFRVRAKRARVGRNPRSGAAAAIAARRVVRFTPSQTLKQVVDGSATAVE